MKSHTVKYYDWFQDVQPTLYNNLCAALTKSGITPPPDFRGGPFKDGKWTDHNTPDYDYIDFWHMYMDVFEEKVRNDSYILTYFPDNDVVEWDHIRYNAVQKHGKLALALVDAVYKMLVDNKIYDKHGSARMVIWFSW